MKRGEVIAMDPSKGEPQQARAEEYVPPELYDLGDAVETTRGGHDCGSIDEITFKRMGCPADL